MTVIATLHQRHENTLPIVRRLYSESTRKPDECFLMCEDYSDWNTADQAAMSYTTKGMNIVHLPTPKNGSKYDVIPYSNKINYALDNMSGDYVLYVDNQSMPHQRKIELMAGALDDNPSWVGVYCAQRRSLDGPVHPADKPTHGYCALNYTQVMHRRAPERWVLDVKYGNPDFADAEYWRAIGDSKDKLFYPVAPDLVLDEHWITDHAVEGL